MVRKRHKKQPAKTPAPTFQPLSGEIDPDAEQLADQAFDKEKIISLMIESAQLADEPEFADLLMDTNKAPQVTERWYRKYGKRLEAAQKQSDEAYQDVEEELFLEVIDELATPAFRKNTINRLQTMQTRLLATHDSDRHESVFLLTLMLGTEKVPWGICNLIVTIYNRTMQETFKSIEAEDDIFAALGEVMQSMGIDPVEAGDVFNSPEKLALLEQKLQTDRPEVLQHAKKIADDLLGPFEEELIRGKVALDIFSVEELQLPFQRIREEFGETADEQSPTKEMQDRSYAIFQESVIAIMTPERFQRFRKQVQSTAIAWQRERRKWASALQLEGSLLNEDKIAENRFIFSTYLGQLQRANEQQPSHPKRKKRRR